MNTLPEAFLHPGSDLHNAAEKSRLRVSFRDRAGGMRNAASIMSEVVARRLRRRETTSLQLVVATGTTRGGGRLTAAWAGAGANGAWCFSSLFDDYTETDRLPSGSLGQLQGMLGDIQENVDVLFTEGIPESFYKRFGLPFLDLPAWIKQRVPVLGDWPLQIDSLRRTTRQEARRFLKKYEFGCRLAREPGDFDDFYDRLYVPYVRRRFGMSAHVVERASFLKECRRGVLLQVTQRNAILGAALLRPLGRTMSVVWSALDSKREPSALRGVTDTLDYFSLLYAHLRGCRWLDMGPSRPDLCDGILRYKAKWGGEIHAGLVPQPRVLLACKGGTEAEREYLGRHAFVTEKRGRFRAVLFIDGDADAAEFGARLSALVTPGVNEYRVVAMSTPSEALRHAVAAIDADVTVVDAAGYPDVMSAAADAVR